MSQNLLFKEHKFVFLHLLSVQIFESIDHVHEVRVLWLLKFGTDEQASEGQLGGITAGEVLWSNETKITIEYGGSGEEGLMRVSSLLVKLEHQLHGV